MGLFSSLFSSPKKKDQMIEWAIETLGREGSIVGMAYKEISYQDFVAYIRIYRCKVLDKIKNPKNGWVEFEAYVNKKEYVVSLSRTFEGSGSVLTSKQK